MSNITTSVSCSRESQVGGAAKSPPTVSWKGRVVSVLKGALVGLIVGSAISALLVLSGGIVALALPIILGAVVASSTSLGALGGRFIYEMVKEKDLSKRPKLILKTDRPIEQSPLPGLKQPAENSSVVFEIPQPMPVPPPTIYINKKKSELPVNPQEKMVTKEEIAIVGAPKKPIAPKEEAVIVKAPRGSPRQRTRYVTFPGLDP